MSSMRRTAPILIVLIAGWRWMQPPLDGSSEFIRYWKHVKSFDAARRCESAISAHYKSQLDQSAPTDEIEQALNSRCVPADYIYAPKPR